MPESPNDNNFLAKLEEKNMTYLFHAPMEGLCLKDSLAALIRAISTFTHHFFLDGGALHQ